MTREQAIVLGFIAAAFVAGWIARALSGVRERSGRGSPQTDQTDQLALVERFEHAIADNRRGFDQALRTYHEMVTTWLARADAGVEADAPLEAEVSNALRDDAANETMLDGVGRGGGALTDRELDLTDWGFTYGVAWARARARRAGEDGEAIAQEALRAAEAVFDAYTDGADWTRAAEGRPSAEAPDPSGPAAGVLRPLSE